MLTIDKAVSSWAGVTCSTSIGSSSSIEITSFGCEGTTLASELIISIGTTTVSRTGVATMGDGGMGVTTFAKDATEPEGSLFLNQTFLTDGAATIAFLLLAAIFFCGEEGGAVGKDLMEGTPLKIAKIRFSRAFGFT